MAANNGVIATKQWRSRKTTGGFISAARIQQSLTAPIERLVLRWLAERTPRWINSDHLTALGLFGQYAAGAAYALARGNKYWLLVAIAAIAVNWLGDSLDGTLARFRDQQRPRYGFYVDHVCDVFGATFLMLGLALSGFCDWRIALGMLLAFLLLSAETYLASYTLGAFKMSYGIFGPTEIRLLLIAGTVRLMFDPMSHLPAMLGGREFRLFDLGGAIAIVGMLAMAVFAVAKHTVQLYREETLR